MVYYTILFPSICGIVTVLPTRSHSDSHAAPFLHIKVSNAGGVCTLCYRTTRYGFLLYMCGNCATNCVQVNMQHHLALKNAVQYNSGIAVSPPHPWHRPIRKAVLGTVFDSRVYHLFDSAILQWLRYTVNETKGLPNPIQWLKWCDLIGLGLGLGLVVVS